MTNELPIGEFRSTIRFDVQDSWYEARCPECRQVFAFYIDPLTIFLDRMQARLQCEHCGRSSTYVPSPPA